ncbi:MAG: PAC2 family protein [archaeon]
MEIKLREKPQNPIIIEGFPGIGLIGTITTEYLIKHLDAKSIGYIWSKNLSPVAAIHESKIIQPLEIFYAKKKNIIILHAMTEIKGLEWEISTTLQELYKLLKAKEIISIEGIMGESEKNSAYYFTNVPGSAKKLSMKAKPLKEGIIMGVTAALLLKEKTMKTTGIFVETHSKLPDSRSSAIILEVLGDYLSLKIDTKPLIQAATEFESKLKDYVGKMQSATKTQEKKAVNYMG